MAVTLRQRTAIVVFAGNDRTSDKGARALARSLGDTGTGVLYLGRQDDGRRIATWANDACADAVEVCVAGGGGVALLRDLLRELSRLDRRGVSIVVHRVQ